MEYENNDWLEKERTESTSFRMQERNIGNIRVSNPGFAVNVYHNVFEGISDELIQKLEDALKNNPQYGWNEAKVTTSNAPVKKARDCVDFKMNTKSLGPINDLNKDLHFVYQTVFDRLRQCVDDYARYWGININFYEIFNFVKYEGEGKHFRIHADDGPHYKCTVSGVVYLNNDYTGGEIYFPRIDNLKIKPGKGDIVLFPSNYTYEHASLPIEEGTKYAVVVMMDINDLAHKDNHYATRISENGQVI